MAKRTRPKKVGWNKPESWFNKQQGKPGSIKPLMSDLKPSECLSPSDIVRQGVVFLQCKEPKGCKRTAADNEKAYCKKHWAQHQKRVQVEKDRAADKKKRIETEDIVMASVIQFTPDEFVTEDLTGMQPAWYKAHKNAKAILADAKEAMKRNKKAAAEAKKNKGKREKKPAKVTDTIVTSDTPTGGAMSFDPMVEAMLNKAKGGDDGED